MRSSTKGPAKTTLYPKPPSATDQSLSTPNTTIAKATTSPRAYKDNDLNNIPIYEVGRMAVSRSVSVPVNLSDYDAPVKNTTPP